MSDPIYPFMLLEEPFERFIEEYVDSFVKWEIVQFFYDHPQTPFTVAELAKIMDRPVRTLKKELHILAAKGLLAQGKKQSHDIYSYQLSGDDPQQAKLGELVEHFVNFCHSREGRLRVIYKILKDGKAVAN